MKTPLFIAFLLLTTVHGSAQGTFPGLKEVLSESEWKRSGLDRLSPDQIGVIDAALIRHHGGVVKQITATAAATASADPVPEQKRGLLQRFGLPSFYEADWRELPPLQATVTEWVSSNRFKLDNGQVWEGFDPITYELVGKKVEIHARPRGQFALIVDGQSTTLRVMRLR